MAWITSLQHGPQIKKALEAFPDRVRQYQLYRRYYDGRHDMRYVTSKFREKFGALFDDMSDNMCPIVVDTISSRLIMDSIAGKGDEKADDFARKSRMDALQRLVHRDAIKEGDGYVILWDDGTGPRMFRNRPDLVCPVYDEGDPSVMLCAVKTWEVSTSQGRKRRITVYYKDRIERYITKGPCDLDMISRVGAMDEFSGDGFPWSSPHQFKRVPVAHFANRAGPGEFGISDLRVVKPLQDAANKGWYDLLVSMETISFAQRYITGYEPEVDPVTGKVRNPFDGKSLWILASEAAKVGQLPAGDVKGILEVLENTRLEIARVSGVPIYYMRADGEPPSGAALRVSEAPLQSKVDDAQVLFGNSWEDIYSMAGVVAEPEAVWRDTAPVSESEQLDAAIKKKSLGYSVAQAMRELGKSEDDVLRIRQERKEEDEAAADLQAKAFSRDPEI